MFNYDCVSFSSIVNVPYVIILSVSICISSLLVWISINTFKTFKFREELFLKLIPPHCMDIAAVICKVFQSTVNKKHEYDVLTKMVYPSLQRPAIVNRVDITLRLYKENGFGLEDEDEQDEDKHRVLYLNSLLVLLLDLDIAEIPDIEEIETSTPEATQRQVLVDI